MTERTEAIAPAAEPKIKYRLSPCPLFDIEGVESWLQEMAARGLVLCRDGFWGGIASFEVRQPCAIRYRLDAATKRQKLFDDPVHPDDEALEIAEAAGWTYLGKYSSFFVYCSDKPDALELNTDPRVQAMTLSLLRRELRHRLFFLLFIVLLHGWKLLGMPLLLFIELGPLLTAWTLLVFLWYWGSALLDVLQVRRLYKKLKNGRPLAHTKDWRRSRRAKWARWILDGVSLVWVFVLFLASADPGVMGKRTPLAEYDQPLPFATIADHAPEGEYRPEGVSFGKYNTLLRRSGFLARDYIDYWESAGVDLPDGTLLQGFVIVYYYELPNEFFAQEVARELVWKDEVNRYHDLTPLEPPEGIKADYLTAYIDVTPTVVLRRGCKVVQYSTSLSLREYEYSDQRTALPLEQWVARVADSLE